MFLRESDKDQVLTWISLKGLPSEGLGKSNTNLEDDEQDPTHTTPSKMSRQLTPEPDQNLTFSFRDIANNQK